MKYTVHYSMTVSESNKTSDIFFVYATTKFDKKDVLFSNDTGNLGKINSECSYQESNLRPS